jgi:hypothetical protein
MTDRRELDRLLVAYFVEGTNELADRVIDAALDQIGHTHQRRPLRVPRRFPTMTMPIRLATAALVGVLAVGGTLYLIQPGKPSLGGPGPMPGTSASPTAPAGSSQTGPMITARQIHTTTTLDDGRVLVTGGYTDVEVAISSVELYDAATNTFSPTGPLAQVRGLHTATRLADGRVLIAGGGPASWVSNVGPYLASAELYDSTTGTMSRTGSMSTAREDHTATLLADGRVLVTGGDDAGSHAVASAELYDPTSGTFSATGSMTTARGFHTATLLADGRVLIVGGDDAAWSAGPFFASAELYDPTTGTFSATGSMTVGRVYQTATRLVDGRVLISGGAGADGGQSLASAELYDPTTGTFSATGSMTVGRVYQTATALVDGRVLITGGLPNGRDYASNPRFLSSAEIFDPLNGTFTATGSMASTRTYHSAALLADGRALITGGVTENRSTSLATAEIYDPRTGMFSPAGDGR